MSTADEQVVDVAFPVRGRSVAGDHGYLVYSALSHVVPELHEAEWLAVHPIRGPRRVDGDVGLVPRSRLTLRIPASRIPSVLPFAGRALRIGEREVWLGAPVVEALTPSASLDAKVVVIKVTRPALTTEGKLDKAQLAKRVSDEIGRQLAKLDVRCDVALTGRREVRVDRRRVIGYSVRLTALSDSDSLAVQRHGVGGKRRMGCGVFVPTHRR